MATKTKPTDNQHFYIISEDALSNATSAYGLTADKAKDLLLDDESDSDFLDDGEVYYVLQRVERFKVVAQTAKLEAY